MDWRTTDGTPSWKERDAMPLTTTLGATVVSAEGEKKTPHPFEPGRLGLWKDDLMAEVDVHLLKARQCQCGHDMAMHRGKCWFTVCMCERFIAKGNLIVNLDGLRILGDVIL